MKTKLILLIALLGLSFFAFGCEDDTRIICWEDCYHISAPKGLYSITGDGAIYLFWERNDEPDLEGYKVYRNTSPSGYFGWIGTTSSASFVDGDVVNGNTYYYVVSAFDYYGDESDVSEVAYDTPRPEGSNRRIYDFVQYPDSAGFDFSAISTEQVVAYDSYNADIYLEWDSYNNAFFLWAANGSTDIQDMGYTDDLDSVNYSPEYGWSEVGWLEVIEGHTYIIWTEDNHFAKLRVISTSWEEGFIDFDWAYQIDPGNRELKVRPEHGEDYLKRDIKKANENSAL